MREHRERDLAVERGRVLGDRLARRAGDRVGELDVAGGVQRRARAREELVDDALHAEVRDRHDVAELVAPEADRPLVLSCMRCFTKPGVVERVAERVGARRLRRTRSAGSERNVGGSPITSSPAISPGRNIMPTGPICRYSTALLEVVADAVVDVDEVVVRRSRTVVGAAGRVVGRGVRADEQRPGSWPSGGARSPGRRRPQHPEAEVREPRGERLDGVASCACRRAASRAASRRCDSARSCSPMTTARRKFCAV